MVIIYSRGGGGGRAQDFTRVTKFSGGDWGDQSSPTEFKGGRLQKMDFHLTSNEGGGVGGSDKFYRDKTEYSGDLPLPLPFHKNNT